MFTANILNIQVADRAASLCIQGCTACGPYHIGCRSMWRSALTLYQLLVTTQSLWAQTDVPVAAVAPQNCSLECIRQGGPECEYCRVTADDIKKTLGFNSTHAFGDCIPWPCLELLGNEDPTICEHYVQAPTDVKVGFVHEPNPEYDTVVVSWKPSHYDVS
ncbi:hypothetical protein ILYODFUR_011932 [Ilyodon furcidens]|uniref:Uncharacterized protein n=1 Tax=Ilyodon furcidens TaxID=33524 RepID=A0ABV0UGS1_9TELE